MRSLQACIRSTIILTGAMLLLSGGASATTPPKVSAKKPTTTHARTTKSSKSKKSRQAWRSRQSKPENARVKEIQAALIHAHYLDGQPTGTWDARSKSAMQKFQSDNGWQTKRIPDSRALIKLGLGPSHDNLLNPDTAYLAAPEPQRNNTPNQR